MLVASMPASELTGVVRGGAGEVFVMWRQGRSCGHGGTPSGEFLGRLQELEAAASLVAKI